MSTCPLFRLAMKYNAKGLTFYGQPNAYVML